MLPSRDAYGMDMRKGICEVPLKDDSKNIFETRFCGRPFLFQVIYPK